MRRLLPVLLTGLSFLTPWLPLAAAQPLAQDYMLVFRNPNPEFYVESRTDPAGRRYAGRHCTGGAPSSMERGATGHSERRAHPAQSRRWQELARTADRVWWQGTCPEIR
ncbi:hypothetical protein [Verrucomicrobium spinosum]|uniref:hypothetical protein n=1 Tax=Verrucomicrobium spinosum TaxID=2736 RepID=UPI000A521339|nr:hypothetical protein [Verrucomicrobium spinosum]